MNWKLWTATSLTLALVVGCSSVPPSTITINTQSGSGGTSPSGGGGAPTGGEVTDVGVGGAQNSYAKEYYLTSVDSSLNASCSSCHATGVNSAPIFLGDNPDSSYYEMDNHGGLIVAPDNSLLLLHGAHTGPALTAAQKDVVTTWLTMEAEVRGLFTGSGTTSTGGGPTATTLTSALADYAACMNINDWTANKLDQLCNVQTTYGPCKGCHSAGDAGNWLSGNTQETFDMNKKFPYIKRQVSGTVDDLGNFKDLVASNRFIQKGTEPCQPNTNCHPAYVLPPDLKTGINNFVAKTIDKWHTKQCSATMP